VSSNNIQVQSDEEVSDFEHFLDAFADTSQLRRLNLSGNNFSGPKAFETLNRVYARHAPVDLLKLLDPEDRDEATLDPESITETTSKLALAEVPADSVLSKNPQEKASHTWRKGLRYVPYIVLYNVQMDDSGALFLSYVLAEHLEKKRLSLSLSVSKNLMHELNSLDEKFDSSGVIYTTDKLSKPCKLMLDHAQKARAAIVKHFEEDYANEDASSSSQSG
jgi:hypothetical protein